MVAAELLLVHKNQIKPEWITEEIEATLRGKAIQWPVGSEVKHLYVVLFWTALWTDGVGGYAVLILVRSTRSLSLSHHLFSPPSLPLSLSLFSGEGIHRRSSSETSVNKVRWPVSKEKIRPARGGGTIVSGRQSGPAWSVRQDK